MSSSRWKREAGKIVKELGEDRQTCEHCLKRVGFTKSRTQMGARFMRKHSIGRQGSMECVGSGVPEKLTKLTKLKGVRR